MRAEWQEIDSWVYFMVRNALQVADKCTPIPIAHGTAWGITGSPVPLLKWEKLPEEPQGRYYLAVAKEDEKPVEVERQRECTDACPSDPTTCSAFESYGCIF